MIPTYELMLLLRIMPKPELNSVLKRIAHGIYEKNGIIRKLDNLGSRPLPFKVSVHGCVYREASNFLIEFNLPPNKLETLSEEYGRDVDIIRRRIFKINPPEYEQCTLHDELLPAPYRKDVQELLMQAKKHTKPKFDYKTGLDYYPFQK